MGILATVAWLSNTEIEKALHRALGSERDLAKERDSLEIKVAERTQELQQAQTEQLIQQYRFIAFGRIAAGLFHDLASPLTSVSLNLENIREESESDSVMEARRGVHV